MRLMRFSSRLLLVGIQYRVSRIGASGAEARQDLDVVVHNDAKVALQVSVLVGTRATGFGSVPAQTSLKNRKLPLPGMDSFQQTVQATNTSLAIHRTGANVALLRYDDSYSKLQARFEDIVVQMLVSLKVSFASNGLYDIESEFCEALTSGREFCLA